MANCTSVYIVNADSGFEMGKMGWYCPHPEERRAWTFLGEMDGSIMVQVWRLGEREVLECLAQQLVDGLIILLTDLEAITATVASVTNILCRILAH